MVLRQSKKKCRLKTKKPNGFFNNFENSFWERDMVTCVYWTHWFIHFAFGEQICQFLLYSSWWQKASNQYGRDVFDFGQISFCSLLLYSLIVTPMLSSDTKSAIQCPIVSSRPHEATRSMSILGGYISGINLHTNIIFIKKHFISLYFSPKVHLTG